MNNTIIYKYSKRISILSQVKFIGRIIEGKHIFHIPAVYNCNTYT